MDPEELAAWLRLWLTPGVGARTQHRLLARFGLPHQVFAQDAGALAAEVGPELARALRAAPPLWREQVEATARWLAQAPDTRRVLTLADAGYPPALLQLADPPLLLWVQGQALAGADVIAWPAQALAIVGSRQATPQGLETARRLARELAGAGMAIVSGLARGIDGAAHEGALEGAPAGQRLATLAVVGTGLDRVYPASHRPLAQRIEHQGLLVSEFALGAGPRADHFPRRNRLIAALARGTLVVEAALQSGSLITARLALEMGREVFAVPGSIHAAQSRGCHALLRQGAALVETALDILDELDPQAARLARGAMAQAKAPSAPAADAPADIALLAALGFDPVAFDTLQARTGLATARLQAGLLALELRGAVARLAGGLFQRIAQA